MSTLQNKKDELIKELIAIKDAIDGIYKNELYENEYTLPESKYIIKEPVIHLKDNFNLKNISLNFPILVKLQENEYIINHYIISLNKNTPGWCYDFSSQYDMNKNICIVYITNYGRLIKSESAIFYISKQEWTATMDNRMGYYYDVCVSPIKNIKNNKLISYATQTIVERCGWNGGGRTIETIGDIQIELIDSPKLLYRMPKLFIDVIDAFHTQNTDLMQECCKTYLEISRESKVKESIMLDIKIKNISYEKDKIIEQKDKIIQNKDTEIEKLKKQLQELQQKYDKIKSMFD
jgi:hypothetical protein